MLKCNYNIIFWIFLLLLLGLSARMFGVSWGVRHDPVSYGFHSDEHRILKTAFLVETDLQTKDHYPAGFAVQVGVLSRLLGVPSESWHDLLILGRMLSLFYGLLIIIVVFFLAREVGFSVLMQYAASLAVALSGLLIVYSHYATADIGLAFWSSTTILFALKSYKRRSYSFLLLALLAASMALAFKLSFVALIPPVVASLRLKRWKWIAFVSVIPVCFLLFETANLWCFSLQDFTRICESVKRGNMASPVNHACAVNPVVYCVEILSALGLPVFLLVVIGIARMLGSHIKTRFKDLDYAVCLTVVLPVVLLFISSCFLSVPFPRHMLSILPLLCIVAGYGLNSFSGLRTAQTKKLLLVPLLCLLIVYEVMYVVSIERPYIIDTRRQMAEWLQDNFNSSNRVYLSRNAKALDWSGLFDRVYDMETADYLILHEYYYTRYLCSTVNPFSSSPSQDQIYHPQKGHRELIQAIFNENAQYKKVKHFSVDYLTPELIFYKWLWGSFPDFAGDTILFEKISCP